MMANAVQRRPLDGVVLLRVINEFIAVLRRHGLRISPCEVRDALMAISMVGVANKEDVHHALMVTLVKEERDRRVFDNVFSSFFLAHQALPLPFLERLALAGFSAESLDTVRELLTTHGDFLQRIADPTGLSGGLSSLFQSENIQYALDGLGNPLQVGFYTQRLSRALGVPQAKVALAQLRVALRGALGDEGDRIADLITEEFRHVDRWIREFIRQESHLRKAPETHTSPRDKRFHTLDPSEYAEVRKAVQTLAQKLRGRVRARLKVKHRGRIDLRRTLRKSWKTQGIPMHVVRKTKRRDKPKMIVLCDVSDSVRLASKFLIELAYALSELFQNTRAFVFVRECAEITNLIKQQSIEHVMQNVLSGSVLSINDNSNYGEALRAFRAQCLDQLDRKTTVIIMGDGRTNYQPTESWVLDELKTRVRRVLWFATEAKSGWSIGDSAMHLYCKHVHRTLSVTTARELEIAARMLIEL